MRHWITPWPAQLSQNGIVRAGNPGGAYDGRYVDDWEYTGAGDLDACNGMEVDGQYGYYVTDAYPWIVRCLSGTPDASFNKGPGG